MDNQVTLDREMMGFVMIKKFTVRENNDKVLWVVTLRKLMIAIVIQFLQWCPRIKAPYLGEHIFRAHRWNQWIPRIEKARYKSRSLQRKFLSYSEWQWMWSVLNDIRRIKTCRSARIPHCSLSISVSHFLDDTYHSTTTYHIVITTISIQKGTYYQNVFITAPRPAGGKQLLQRTTPIRYDIQTFSAQQRYTYLSHQRIP